MAQNVARKGTREAHRPRQPPNPNPNPDPKTLRALCVFAVKNVAHRPPHDWAAWRADLQAQRPPGVARLAPLGQLPPINPEQEADPAHFVARIVDLLTAAAADPALLAAVAQSGVTLECCLTSNAILGAVPTAAAHPLPRFLAAGIPIILATDDPVQLGTTIGRKYTHAHALGCTLTDLATCTHNAITAAFTTPTRRANLLARLTPNLTPGPLLKQYTP